MVMMVMVMVGGGDDKKNHLQCLWGSVVVLLIIYQCQWDVCGTPYVLKGKIYNVCGVLWDSNIIKRNICNVCGVLWDSIFTKKRHCKCFFLVYIESHRTPQTLQMFLFTI